MTSTQTPARTSPKRRGFLRVGLIALLPLVAFASFAMLSALGSYRAADGARLRDGGAEVVGGVLDATAERQAEARTMAAARMASLGEMAAGLAHEMRQPLQSISLAADQEAVLALLRREEGATIAQICEANGWQQYTVRGFFAGLKKHQGIEVQVLERIRQVGPNDAGARVLLGR